MKAPGGIGAQDKPQSGIEAFAAKHRFRIETSADKERVIHGRRGHIFEYGNGLLGVTIKPKGTSPRSWNAARNSFLEAGMTITQDGDSEGVATFDPANREQRRLATKHAGIKRKKVATAAQLAALSGYRASKSAQNMSGGTRASPDG